MSANLTEQQQYAGARTRAKSKLGFYIHAAAYVLVNALLAYLSISSGKTWYIWPLAGWGAGLVLHGVCVFVLRSRNSLTERMIDRMARDEMHRD